MLSELAPLVTLVIGAGLIFLAGRLVRVIGKPEAIGYGVGLCVVGVVFGLSPVTWRAQWAGGNGGDRLLTYLRLVGFTGLMFIAGTHFTTGSVWEGLLASFGVFGLLLFTTITLILTFLFNQSVGSAVLIAAAAVSASLWFSADSSHSSNESSSSLSAAVALSASALIGLYFVGVFEAIPGARRGLSVYVIVTLYELVKLGVVFGFAYFIFGQFLMRAKGRISSIRTSIGFILLSILLYALMSFAVSSLGAIAWAFLAGVLWRDSKLGQHFSLGNKPIASALLLSFVFFSMALQSHGRPFGFSGLLVVIAIVVISLKLAVTWVLSKRLSINQGQQASLFAAVAFPGEMAFAAVAFPGEMAILFLSFSVIKWLIDAPIFFAVLIYGFASTVLIPVLIDVAQRFGIQKKRLVVNKGMKTVF